MERLGTETRNSSTAQPGPAGEVRAWAFRQRPRGTGLSSPCSGSPGKFVTTRTPSYLDGSRTLCDCQK